MGESPRTGVHSASKHTLGSDHETHKGVRPKTNWLVSSRVGRNPKLVQGYLHEMLEPYEHAYKRDNI